MYNGYERDKKDIQALGIQTNSYFLEQVKARILAGDNVLIDSETDYVTYANYVRVRSYVNSEPVIATTYALLCGNLKGVLRERIKNKNYKRYKFGKEKQYETDVLNNLMDDTDRFSSIFYNYSEYSKNWKETKFTKVDKKVREKLLKEVDGAAVEYTTYFMKGM